MDLARLDAWIRRERVVTVVGPPGVGKTTLALEHARRYGSAVAFCDLTEATNLARIGTVVAQALETPAQTETDRPPDPSADIVDAIGAMLASRGGAPLLVVLDNFEQAVAHAHVVTRWAELAPEIRWLVTSRERLGIAGERVLELEPLAVPAPGEGARDSDGVRLFMQRARGARREYVLTEANEPIVAAIVRELDGLPLAIELAATLMSTLSPAQILAEIGERFPLLAQTARPAGARGTLWHVVESAFLTLGEHERAALAQCSVFRGGFDAAAATAVVDLPRGAPPVTEVLGRLVDKSLLRGGEGRYGMLLSIREYAARRLDAEGLTADTEDRHAQYFVRAGRVLSRAASGPDGARARREIAIETDNLLAVHRRAIAREPRAPEGVATACKAALTLGASVVRGRLPLCLDTIETALAEAEHVALPPALHGRTLECYAWLSWFAGHLRECAESASRAVNLAETAGTPTLLGHSLAILAKARLALGQVDAARALVERALDVHRRCGDAREEGRCLALLADVSAASGSDAAAVDLYECALAIHRAARDAHDEGETLGRLGDLALARGGAAQARAWHEQALSRHGSVGNGRAEVTTRMRLAQCDEEQRDLQRARAALEATARASVDLGDRALERDVVEALGTCALEQDDLDAAVRALERARDLHARAPSPRSTLVLVELAVARARRAERAPATGDLDALEWPPRGAGENRPVTIVPTDGPLGVAVEVHAASLALARGDSRPARAALTGSANAALRSFDVRVARRVLERALGDVSEAGPLGRLVVGESGRWFRVGDGERVDLGRRRALRLLVQRLAEARATAPNTALSADVLVDVGWPGERLVAQTGADRLYTALSTLRKMGLRSVLESRDDGYLFDPRRPFERCEDA